MTSRTTYNKTHPWLTFHADLSHAPSILWVILGECQSKCEHISGAPLEPEVAKELHTIYLAKGVNATTAIEGNTLTESQVRAQIEGKLELPLSQEYLKQEVQNILDECNQRIIRDIVDGRTPPLSVNRIKEINKGVLKGLNLEKGVTPGEIRKYSIGVGGFAHYRAPEWRDCEKLMGRLCDWLNGGDFAPQKGFEIVFPFIKAALSHLYLAWIHPFGDGNGRTARLVEFQILISSGVPLPAAHLLSDHFNQTRHEYYLQLKRSSESGGDVIPFLLYAAQGFLDGLKAQLQKIREMQLDTMWREYVYSAFKDKKSDADHRRRTLVLEISNQKELVPYKRLRILSPELAERYDGKTDRTLTRDIGALIKMGLIKRGTGGFRALKERILSFLPIRADNQTSSPEAP